jgi:hypothetical protein
MSLLRAPLAVLTAALALSVTLVGVGLRGPGAVSVVAAAAPAGPGTVASSRTTEPSLAWSETTTVPAERRAAPESSGRRDAEGPLLARGRVTDESGRPIQGAMVRVDLAGADPLECRSDASGGFALHASTRAERVTLTATHPKYTAAGPTSCAVGDAGVQLRLRAAGSITGRLIVEPKLSMGLFTVSAVSSADERATYRGSIEGRGTLAIPGLPAGTYDVAVALEHEPDTALEIRDVYVAAGITMQLAPIDLTGRVSTFRLRVTDAAGGALDNAFARRRAAGEPVFGTLAQPLRDGRALIATLHPCVDLRVEAPRYRPESLDCVSADVDVSLQSAPTVQIVLENGLPSRDDRLHFGASVERQRGATGHYGRMCSFDERGIAEAVIEEPGRYDVRIYVWEQAGAGVGALLSNRVESQIDVPDGASGGIFAVRLAPETLTRIEELGARD